MLFIVFLDATLYDLSQNIIKWPHLSPCDKIKISKSTLGKFKDAKGTLLSSTFEEKRVSLLFHLKAL